MSESNANPAGLVSGHAQYAKGAAVETIGNVTGSKEWQDSGAADKAAGLDSMKAAGEQRQNDLAQSQDAQGQQSYLGKAEELAGKAVGCEGMENEGRQDSSS